MSYSSDPASTIAQGINPQGDVQDVSVDLSGSVRFTNEDIYGILEAVLKELKKQTKMMAAIFQTESPED